LRAQHQKNRIGFQDAEKGDNGFNGIVQKDGDAVPPLDSPKSKEGGYLIGDTIDLVIGQMLAPVNKSHLLWSSSSAVF
jgi:isocitrate lyase